MHKTQTTEHGPRKTRITELISDTVVIQTPADASQLIADVSYGESSGKLIVRQSHLAPEFFDLKTRFAGEVLQRFVNYRMQLAIVGDFAEARSEALQAFIAESNRGRQVFFVETVELARESLLAAEL